MTRYRYKTAIVSGPWRETRRDAMVDAIRNGFASWADSEWQDLKWRFPGEIEEEEES